MLDGMRMSIQQALICDRCGEIVLAGDGIDHVSHVYGLARPKGWQCGRKVPGDRSTAWSDTCPACMVGGAA